MRRLFEVKVNCCRFLTILFEGKFNCCASLCYTSFVFINLKQMELIRWHNGIYNTKNGFLPNI